MKSTPYLIKADKSGSALQTILPGKASFQEVWLQELLQSHPQILPVDEIDPIFWPLIPIGREVMTTAGPIDNLFISKTGYPVLVETKLWRNSEARREVLAQAIDYASALSQWTFTKLDDECKKKNQKGIIELIQDAFDSDPDEIPNEDLISQNLKLGRFLVLVVSDHIRNSMIEMVNYVNRFPHLATNVGLVELQCYQVPNGQADVIVVPSIIARTEIIERSIVQVNLNPNVEHQIIVEQRISKKEKTTSLRAISEDVFWETLQRNSKDSVAIAKRIFEHYRAHPEVSLQMRQSAIVARLNLPDNDQRISLFYISVDGTIACWASTVIVQLDNASIDKRLGEDYKNAMSVLLHKRTKSLAIHTSVQKVDEKTFIQTVDRFIENVLSFCSNR